MTTLYNTLGVPDTATGDEIKRAYRKAAMRWHPDRNAGQEIAARNAFLDVQNAYAILSDPEQRRVYDAVFAEEMQRQETRLREAEREQASKEAAARAEEEARYAERVALAMRFASQGYNRDVVLGVLLGHDCCSPLANQIADSVIALHASRQDIAPTMPAENVSLSVDEPSPKTEQAPRTLSDFWFPFWNALRP